MPPLLRHASCIAGGLCHLRSSPRPGAVPTLCRPGACSSLLRLARILRWQTYMPTCLVTQPLSQHRCSMQTVTCAARRRSCGWCIRTAQLPITLGPPQQHSHNHRRMRVLCTGVRVHGALEAGQQYLLRDFHSGRQPTERTTPSPSLPGPHVGSYGRLR